MVTDPLFLLQSTNKLYEAAALDWVTRTTEKLIKFRRWDTTLEELRPVVEQAGVKYIPGQLLAAPAYLFPVFSPLGNMTLAQVRYVRPVGLSEMRYQVLGQMACHCGPLWFGLDKPTRSQIIQTRTVMVVEGPMDVLACRVILGPNVPVVCGLGKTLTRKHETDLHLLGVRKVVCMWDKDAAGFSAVIPESIPERVKLRCPAKDPSDCLRSYELGKRLYNEVQLAYSHPIWARLISGEDLDAMVQQSRIPSQQS